MNRLFEAKSQFIPLLTNKTTINSHDAVQNNSKTTKQRRNKTTMATNKTRITNGFNQQNIFTI